MFFGCKNKEKVRKLQIFIPLSIHLGVILGDSKQYWNLHPGYCVEALWIPLLIDSILSKVCIMPNILMIS